MQKLTLNLGLAGALLFAGVSLSGAAETRETRQEQAKKLIAVLQSGAPQKEKADACRELAVIGGRDAIAPLAKLLEDEQLSHMARYGLETIPDSAVDKAFREALGRLRGRPLMGVISSVGVRRDAGAVKQLAKFLEDGDSEVAQAAARALGDIAAPAGAAALRKSLSRAPVGAQLAFYEGLFRCAEAFAAKGQRRQAVEIYDELRQKEAPQQVRTAALRGAILYRQKDAVPLLVETLRSQDYAQFARGARIALEMPGAEVTRALVAELDKVSGDRQILLLQTLGKRADAAALPDVLRAASSREKNVRIAALRAVPEFGSASAAAALLGMIGDSDAEVARTAQESLASLRGAEVDAAVLGLLSSAQVERHLTGLELVARRRMVYALPALFKDARSTEARVRGSAIRKIGDLAGPDNVPALLDLMANTSAGEDLEAVEQALGAVCVNARNPESCVDQIQSAFAQAQPARKSALIRVMAAVGGPKALTSVRSAVADSNSEVRSAAVRALGSWNSMDAAPALLDLAKTGKDSTERMLALRGYLRLAGQGDVPEAQRLAMCKEASAIIQKDDERKLLLAALGNANSPEALALIVPCFGSSAVNDEASSAVVAISDRILKGADAAKAAPKLIEPLRKAVEAASSDNLRTRAQRLLELAQSKAGK
jgi:HEAT repeat protein